MTDQFKFRLLLSLPLLLIFMKLEAQVPVTSDSLKDEKGAIVEKLESKKNKSALGRFFYKSLVRKPKTVENRKVDIQKRPAPLSDAEGKIIRNIKINTLDPFGYSIENPEAQPKKFFEKAGNTLHPKTKNFVIKNYLLLKPGKALDSIKLLESERLIRNQRFSRNVRIDFEEAGDSVDLVVNTLDSWTLFPSMTFSGSKVGFRLRERNFMGWGHDFDNLYRQNFETGKNQIQSRYSIPNIQRTFIGFSVGYSANEDNEYIKSVSLQRRFFSPFTRWAGGALHGERSYQDSIPNNIGVSAYEIKYRLADFWGGYSFRLFDEHSAETKFSNLIFSARYFNADYRKHPDEVFDPDRFYADQRFALIGVGFSRRGFVQDKFIRNYNIIEDIPVGMTLGLTSGVQWKNHRERFYLAGGLKMGEYMNLGYVGFNLQYGGFLSAGRSEESVFSLNLDYFTRLKSWGNWKFRGFLSTDLIIGNNRANSRGDRLTLNENDPLGINGFYSINVVGTKKWLTDFQIHSYSPYHFLGFRLSPVFSSSFGLISGEDQRLSKGRLFTRIGLGVMLTNDFLVFSNFQLSFSWYNQIPGQGNDLFKTNTLQTSDFYLPDFGFGKPELIEYSPFTPR